MATDSPAGATAPRALLDLLLPTICAGCAEPGAIWCARCRPRPGPPVALGVAGHGRQPPPVFAVAAYRGPLRAALLGYKERGRRGLAVAFGQWLAAALQALPADVRRDATGSDGCWWLVPVPSRRRAATRRGGQHVAAVAAAAAAGLAASGQPVAVAAALRMSHGVRDSVGLDPEARRANVAGHMLLRPRGAPPPGKPVLVVDDIVTTGATAAECTAALQRSGVTVAAFVALAAAGDHSGLTWPDPQRARRARIEG